MLRTALVRSVTNFSCIRFYFTFLYNSMLLSLLILVPFFGTFIILLFFTDKKEINAKTLKITALFVTVVDLFISLIIWFLFDNSSKHFQFIQEHYTVGHYDFYLGLDGLSIYFVLLTTLIAPVSIISN